ncbi:hypothetical protein AWV80_39840 [Cupriavidus sp. UYMU48A]|nr:hypothetical protein AWV80_39840 [Cupriavidus sp. UYMU48A]
MGSSLGRRWNPHGSGGHALGDLGLTPILRLQGAGRSGVFVEAGVGVHVLSRTPGVRTKDLRPRSSSAIA